MEDLFDNVGTPKYKYPQDIYDGLQAMANGEEIGIISEMFKDVSWENQDYYYADNGAKLVERWERITDYGDKMWIMDVAAWQMDKDDANEMMYQILCNDDLAKRIGFKKIFVDKALSGTTSKYESVSEAFAEELSELDRYDFRSNSDALEAALEGNGYCVIKNMYGELCTDVYNKLRGLRLDEERQLIAESRAMLTAYDDFMYGLKSNQYLYNQQETMYKKRVAALKDSYAMAVRALLLAAKEQGVMLNLPGENILLLEEEKP